MPNCFLTKAQKQLNGERLPLLQMVVEQLNIHRQKERKDGRTDGRKDGRKERRKNLDLSLTPYTKPIIDLNEK